jgi:hypothetical protein
MGDTELTELALLVAARFSELKIICIIDESATRKEHYGIPVVRSGCELQDLVKRQSVDVIMACHYLASIDEFMGGSDFFNGFELDQSRFLVPEFLQ